MSTQTKKFQFSIDFLNDVLTQTKSMKKKLSPLLAQFSKNKIQLIWQTLNYLKKCMTSPKGNILYKFNSLFALKVLFDTSEFILINWIEVFFLPSILDIARTLLTQPQSSGKDYFIKLGYTQKDEKQIQKFGYNYTLLATQLIYIGSLVKPKKLFQFQLSDTDSQFSKAFQQLKSLGYRLPQKLAIYSKPTTIQQQVTRFQNYLQTTPQQVIQKYQQFCLSKVDQYLEQDPYKQQRHVISVVQLCQSGDIFVSTPTIETLSAILRQMPSFRVLRNSLNFMHKFMLVADYEAYYALNYDDTLNNLLNDLLIACDNTSDKSLKTQTKFLKSKFNNKPQQSKQIYQLFLGYLQKWSVFIGMQYPKKDENYLNEIVVALQKKLNLQLPRPLGLQTDKKILYLNQIQNRERNSILAEEKQKKPSSLIKILKKIQIASSSGTFDIIQPVTVKNMQKNSSKPIPASQKQTPKPPKSQKGDMEHPFMKKLYSVEQTYSKLLTDKPNFQRNKAILQEYSSSLDQQLLRIPQQLFELIVQRATGLNEQIQEVLRLVENGNFVQDKQQQQPYKAASNRNVQSQGFQQRKQVQQIKEPTRKTRQPILQQDTPVKMFSQYQQAQRSKQPSNHQRFNSNHENAHKLGYTGDDFLDSKFKLTEESNFAKLVKQADVKQIGNKIQDSMSDRQRPQEVIIKQQGPGMSADKLGYKQEAYKDQHPIKNNKVSNNSRGLALQQRAGYNAALHIQNQQSSPVNQVLGYSRTSQKSQNHASSRSIRKTQNLGYKQQRKRIQQDQSSMKSNSKVQKFQADSSLEFNNHLNDLGHNYEDRHSDFKRKSQHQQQNIKHNNLGYQQQEELHLQQQENLSANKPKQFTSLSGKYLTGQGNNIDSANKISEQSRKVSHLNISPHDRASQQQYLQKNQQPQIKRHQFPQLHQNSIDSQIHYQRNPQLSSYNQLSKVSKLILTQKQQYQQILQQDDINAPSLNPMEESFHDIGEIQQRIKSRISNIHAGNLYDSPGSRNTDSLRVDRNNILSFKNCFQADKYILQQKQNKKNKMYWLQNDTNNLIKTMSGNNKQKSRTSKINVPQLLEQRNRRYQNQLKSVQQQKNGKIKQLQSKVKNLQKQSQNMKQKLYVYTEQIKTLRASSEYDKQSMGQKGYIMDVDYIAAQKHSTPSNKFSFTGLKGLQFEKTNFKGTAYLDPKGKLINSKSYRQYFQQFRGQKQKKSILKTKDLLYKDKDIEVGFMSRKQNQKLIITLFVTPQRQMQSLTWNVSSDANRLRVESEPGYSIPFIRMKKQEKIFLLVSILKLPYNLPEVTFHYTMQGQMSTVKVIVPCAFHKFIYVKQSDDAVLNEYFQRSENIIRGEQVPYSRRMLKNFQNLKEYFQSMSVVNKGQVNSQGQLCYGGTAHYKQHRFPIRISIKPNQFLYVQGYNSYNHNKQVDEMIEWYICTVTHLLMKEID